MMLARTQTRVLLNLNLVDWRTKQQDRVWREELTSRLALARLLFHDPLCALCWL